MRDANSRQRGGGILCVSVCVSLCVCVHVRGYGGVCVLVWGGKEDGHITKVHQGTFLHSVGTAINSKLAFP